MRAVLSECVWLRTHKPADHYRARGGDTSVNNNVNEIRRDNVGTGFPTSVLHLTSELDARSLMNVLYGEGGVRAE